MWHREAMPCDGRVGVANLSMTISSQGAHIFATCHPICAWAQPAIALILSSRPAIKRMYHMAPWYKCTAVGWSGWLQRSTNDHRKLDYRLWVSQNWTFSVMNDQKCKCMYLNQHWQKIRTPKLRKMVGKTCRGVALRGIMPTLRSISRMAPVDCVNPPELL